MGEVAARFVLKPPKSNGGLAETGKVGTARCAVRTPQRGGPTCPIMPCHHASPSTPHPVEPASADHLKRTIRTFRRRRPDRIQRRPEVVNTQQPQLLRYFRVLPD